MTASRWSRTRLLQTSLSIEGDEIVHQCRLALIDVCYHCCLASLGGWQDDDVLLDSAVQDTAYTLLLWKGME
jgi:hypothetical protein